MRRMSAGSGYQYLLRSVAAGDGRRAMSTPLTRYYSEPGKYTGLFWPVNPPKFQRLTGLGLIDLDRFKEQAEKKRDTVRIDLGPPSVESQVPPPPIVSPSME